jgi:hypothetical protein
MFLLFSFFSMASIAQPSATINDPGAKMRTLSGSFSAITVSDGITLYLTEGDAESIAVGFSDQKFEERFKTVVEEGVLKIYYDGKGINWSNNSRRKLKAYVSFKTLQKLTATGGADVIVPVAIHVDDFFMKFTSGTRFTGKVTAKDMEVIQTSGSDIQISGSAQKINIESNSGASFKGYEFSVDYCVAKATSGAGIRISIQKELEAEANSGGAIHYKGNGVIKDININSGGVVKKSIK